MGARRLWKNRTMRLSEANRIVLGQCTRDVAESQKRRLDDIGFWQVPETASIVDFPGGCCTLRTSRARTVCIKEKHSMVNEGEGYVSFFSFLGPLQQTPRGS